MELIQYLEIIWWRKWVILSTLLIVLLITAVGTFSTAPSYSAAATMRIATAAGGTLSNLRYDLNYADRLMSTYENIATSAPILFKLEQAYGDIDEDAISVKILANTELMSIAAEHTDAARAADIANMAADLLLAEMRNSGGAKQTNLTELQAEIVVVETEIAEARQAYEEILVLNDADSEKALAAEQVLNVKRDVYGTMLSTYEQARLLQSAQQGSASVITPARIPDKPSKPNRPLNFALGTLLGLLGGLALAFLFENLDSRLRTREQVEAALQLPTLGRIPTATANKASKYGAPLEEAYRRLGANILSHVRSAGDKVFVITSGVSGEGKTTVAANLASSLSYSGLSVAVVDCDLHNPSLHTLFGISNERGLTSVLAKQVSLSDALQKPPMMHASVLASGPISANPFDTTPYPSSVMRRVHPGQVELLSTSQMVATINALRERFDIVLLDTAPSLEVTDSAVLSPLVDGVLLVIDLSQAEQTVLREVHQQLEDVNANVIGCVLTRDNSRLAYSKNMRQRNERKMSNNTPAFNGVPAQQAYGHYIAMPTELTRANQIKNHVADDRTRPVQNVSSEIN